MKVNPYVFFNGKCEEALEFYGKTLGTKPELMRVKGSPAEQHFPPDWKDKILHGRRRTHLQGVLAGRQGGYAARQDLLREELRHADRPLRCPLDDHLRVGR